MDSLHNKMICLLLFLIGTLMLAGGVYGWTSLARFSKTSIRTTGVINTIRSERKYRFRKMRIRREMRISYRTEKYGSLYVSKKCYLPFRSEGDSLEVLYDSGNPYDVRIPGDERCIWTVMLATGVLCVAGGWLMRKSHHRLE